MFNYLKVIVFTYLRFPLIVIILALTQIYEKAFILKNIISKETLNIISFCEAFS